MDNAAISIARHLDVGTGPEAQVVRVSNNMWADQEPKVVEYGRRELGSKAPALSGPHWSLRLTRSCAIFFFFGSQVLAAIIFCSSCFSILFLFFKRFIDYFRRRRHSITL